MIALRMLGSLELTDERGEAAVSVLAQPKRVALLVYLALARPPGFHRRDTLLALFWPEADETHARRALNQAFHQLRCGLGPELIVTQGNDAVRLDETRYRCDVRDFRESLLAGRLEDAVALYRAELLPGFHTQASVEFDEWLDSQRRELHGAAVEAALTLQRRADEHRCDDAALHWSRHARALAPLDERCARQLIQTLIRVGDHAGARAEYDRFAERVQRELEVNPSPETTALIASVARREILPSLAKPAAVAALSAASSLETHPAASVHASPPRVRRLRRWIGAGTVAAAIVSGSLMATAGHPGPVLRLSTSGGARPSILVADFTGPPRDSALGDVASQLVLSGLQDSRTARVVSSAEVRDALARMQLPASTRVRGAVARELAIREGYGAVIDGSVQAIGGKILVSMTLADAASAHALLTKAEPAADADMLTRAVDKLVRSAREIIGDSAAAIARARPLAQVTTPSLEALRDYTEAGRLGMARARQIALVERAIAHDSGFASAYRRLSMYMYWDNQADRSSMLLWQALRHADRLSDVERRHTEAILYARGRFYDPERALAALDILVERDSSDITALSYAGITLLNLRRYDRAVVVLERQLRARGSAAAPAAYFTLAWTHFRRGDSLTGWRLLEAGLQHSPHAELYLARARANLLFGRIDSAEADLGRASAATSAADRPFITEDVSALRSSIALRAGRLRDARPFDDERLRAAHIRNNRREEVTARADYVHSALLVRRDTAAALRELASLRRLADSIRGIDRPGPILASLYADAGRPAIATRVIRDFESHIALGEWEETLPSRHQAWAHIALAEGRTADAVREARLGDRGFCVICGLPLLSLAYERAGLRDSAIAVGERYLHTLSPDRAAVEGVEAPHLHRRLGSLYAEKGDVPRAREHLDAFIAMWSNADPDLRPQVDEARRQLARLGRRVSSPDR